MTNAIATSAAVSVDATVRIGKKSYALHDAMSHGASDPLHWGTSGVVTNFEWSEQFPAPGISANVVGDRRFVQSAGPFVLEPGALNNITFGVVYGRAFDGDPFSSFLEVKIKWM